MGLFKNFRMSTDMNVQFRAEFFNVFNQVNFDIPDTNRQRRRTSAASRGPIRASVIRGSSSSG